jgi:hypothetical protein
MRDPWTRPERFQAKWIPVRVKKTRQNTIIRQFSGCRIYVAGAIFLGVIGLQQPKLHLAATLVKIPQLPFWSN